MICGFGDMKNNPPPVPQPTTSGKLPVSPIPAFWIILAIENGAVYSASGDPAMAWDNAVDGYVEALKDWPEATVLHVWSGRTEDHTDAARREVQARLNRLAEKLGGV